MIETAILQAIVYIFVFAGAMLKVVSKYYQDGNYINAQHLTAIVMLIMTVLAVTSQTIVSLDISAFPTYMSLFIAALLLGWGAGDVAYQTGLKLDSVSTSKTTSTTQSAATPATDTTVTTAPVPEPAPVPVGPTPEQIVATAALAQAADALKQASDAIDAAQKATA